MPATRTQAVDDVLGLLNTTWTSSVVPLGFEALLFEDNRQDRPDDVDGSGNLRPWGRAELQHATGNQTSLGGVGGDSTHTRTGTLLVSVYTAGGGGRSKSDAACQALEAAFAGKHTTNGVWFRSVRSIEIGQSGPWFRVNFLASFEYDLVL